MRVAIYIRVSTNHQVKDGDSLKEQEISLAKYANENGYTIVDVCRDEGVSGTKNDRDGLNKLIEDVKADKIDLIIFTFLSRWHRSLHHHLVMQEILNKHNVNWKAIHEPQYDTTTPSGKMIVSVMMAIAELALASEKIKTVFDYKVTIGEVINGNKLFGYDIIPNPNGSGKIYAINEDEAEIVRAVFNHFKKCHNIRSTRKFMSDELGIHREIATVQNGWLRNIKYKGECRDNKNYAPAIIDPDTFDEVQRILAMNIRHEAKHVFIFSKLIRCKTCGGAYSGSTYTSKMGQHTYTKVHGTDALIRFLDSVCATKVNLSLNSKSKNSYWTI